MQGNWTPDQIKFIEWRATPRFDRIPPTQEMLAEAIGVDDSTLYRWSRMEGFQEEVNKLARSGLGHRLPEVYGALFREAEKGEYQHIQLILELTGEYVRKQHNVNQSDVKGELTFRFVEEEETAADDSP